MYGEKLKGEFHMFKLANEEKNWLIIKSDDEYADEDWEIQTVLKKMKRRDAADKLK